MHVLLVTKEFHHLVGQNVLWILIVHQQNRAQTKNVWTHVQAPAVLMQNVEYIIMFLFVTVEMVTMGIRFYNVLLSKMNRLRQRPVTHHLVDQILFVEQLVIHHLAVVNKGILVQLHIADLNA